MKIRYLIALAVVAAVVVVGAVLAVRDREGGALDRLAEKPLFPDLLGQANDIASLEVTHAGDSFVIEPVDGVWALPSKDGYPARYELVKQTILAIGEAETVEAKTADPARYGELGLGDPTAPDTESTLVRVSDKEGDVLAALILGKQRANTAGLRYFRLPEERRTWLARLDTEAGGTPMDWIDRTVLEIDRMRINHVQITQPDGATLTIAPKEDEAGFRLVELPEGRKIRTPYTLGGIISGLMTVRINDVAQAGSVDFDRSPTVARYETREGLIITVTTVDRDGQVWGRFDFAHDPSIAIPEEETEGVVNPGPGQDQADIEPEEIDPAGQAAELEAALSPWAFALPTHIAEQFRKGLGDVLLQEGAEAPPMAGGSDPEQEMQELQNLLRSRMPGAAEQSGTAPPTPGTAPAPGTPAR